MKPRADAPQASTAWSIPEIRVVKDERGRLRIDQSDPATYGAYTAHQLLATAEASPQYRDGMTKRPSTSSIRITFVNSAGQPQAIGVKEIFCRMDGDALVLTQFETADGRKVKDLPIAVPSPSPSPQPPPPPPPPLPPSPTSASPSASPSPSPSDDLDEEDVDDLDRLHAIAMAHLDDDSPTPRARIKPEPEPEPPPAEPPRERRRPTGPLRQYDEPAAGPGRGPGPGPGPNAAPSAPAAAAAAGALRAPSAPESSPRGPAVLPPAARAAGAGAGSGAGATIVAPAAPTIRALDEAEAAALRALIEARAGETRWASTLLMQAAERFPSDRKQQNEHLANLLKVSVDLTRSEYRTPLGGALRGILEEVHAYKAGVLDRDPLKAEKVALQPFARTVFAPIPVDDGPVKTVSGTAQRTPAQVLAKLEDPKLARATRIKYLLEVVPELIETWRPDKESDHSEAANESSPAIVRRLFAVANEQRQQRKFIDDGSTFRKAGDRYKALEGKLPKPPGDG